MKPKTILIICFCIFNIKVNYRIKAQTDYVHALTDTLLKIQEDSEDSFFNLHCTSIIDVIRAKTNLTKQDTAFIKTIYSTFNNMSDAYNAKKFSSYTSRMKSMIISWVSPTDGATSFSWLKLPKDWDPEKEYPLYVFLHGKWFVADNPIEYLAYPYQNISDYQYSYEDGYLLSPWGRGNFWYEGISETDIFECINALNNVAGIDHTRMYITGHSMGGYGSWYLAQKTPGYWAAAGDYAGALWWDNAKLLNSDVARKLKDLPFYFVCGDQDGNLFTTQTAYQLLLDAGNSNVEFVTFHGGHEFLEEIIYNMYLWMREFSNDNWSNIHDVTNAPGSKILSIFPNPVKDKANLKICLPQQSKALLYVYDINGRILNTVLLDEIKTNVFSLDVSGYSAGIYTIKLKAGASVAETKMLIVR
jgi:hypothetical protein